MLTVNQVLQSLPDGTLRKAVMEGLEWNTSGLLQGDALHYVAERLRAEAGIETDGLLRDADTLVCRESAKRFAALGKQDESWAMPFDKLLSELMAGLRGNGTTLSNRAMAAMMVAQMQLGQTPQMTGFGVEFVRDDGSKTFGMVSVAEYAKLLKRREEGDLRGTINVRGASQHDLAGDASWSDGTP